MMQYKNVLCSFYVSELLKPKTKPKHGVPIIRREAVEDLWG